MDFSQALLSLKQGELVQRTGWNGKGMYVLLEPGEGNRHAYVALKAADGQIVPWAPSQMDLLAKDWESYQTSV